MSNKKIYLTIGLIFVILLVGPYLRENYLGAKRWTEVESRMKDAGLKLSLEEFQREQSTNKPDLPPIITALWDFETNEEGGIIYRTPELRDEFLNLTLNPENYKKAVFNLPWTKGAHCDLGEMIESLSTQKRFTVPESGTDGLKILTAFNEYSDILNVIDKAVKKQPEAQIPIETSKPFTEFIAMEMPWLDDIRPHLLFQKVRGVSAVSEGDTGTALKSVSALRFFGSLVASNTLLGDLVRSHSASMIHQIVWEGITTKAWSTEDLRVIEQLLASMSLLDNLEKSYNLEQVMIIAGACDHIKGLPPGERKGILSQMVEVDSSELWWAPLVPVGIWDKNKALGCEILLDHCILPIRNQELTNPPSVTSKIGDPTPYNVLVHVTIPAYEGISTSLCHKQTRTNMIRLACVLERFYIAKSRYPEGLTELVPDFLDEIPMDIMSDKFQKPLIYKKTDAGFLLYSRGLDGVDDKGEVKWTSSGNRNWRASDWVWSIPALQPPKPSAINED